MNELENREQGLKEFVLSSIEHLRELKGCTGIIGIGSNFAPDLQASEASDIDLLVIQDTELLVKTTTLYQKRFFDFTICALNTVGNICEHGVHSDYWRENLKYSQIIYDETNAVAEFLEELEAKSKDIGLITMPKAKLCKVRVRNILRKINHSVSPEYFFMREAGQLPELLYFLNCYEKKVKPYMHPQRQYIHICTEFPEVSRIMVAISCANSVNTKIAEVTELCERFLFSVVPNLRFYGVITKVLAKKIEG